MMNNELCDLWEQRLLDYEASEQIIVAWCKEYNFPQGNFTLRNLGVKF